MEVLSTFWEVSCKWQGSIRGRITGRIRDRMNWRVYYKWRSWKNDTLSDCFPNQKSISSLWRILRDTVSSFLLLTEIWLSWRCNTLITFSSSFSSCSFKECQIRRWEWIGHTMQIWIWNRFWPLKTGYEWIYESVETLVWYGILMYVWWSTSLQYHI